MRYFKLNERFALRGFSSGKTFALIDDTNGKHISIDPFVAEVLKLCNGRVDFDLPVFPLEYEKILKTLVDCGYIDIKETRDEILPYQEYKETSLREIRMLQWSVTGKCNLRCKHCYQGAPGKVTNDLDTEAMLKAIDNLGENFVTRICITGGDPFVRKDWPVLLERMAKNHIKIFSVFTNGILLDDKILDIFEGYGMHPAFQLSFDGVGCHDWLRGVEGAEEKLIKAIKLLRKRDYSVTAAMCIHKGNVHSLHDTVKLCDELGCKAIRICPVSSFGRYNEDNGVETFSVRELFEIYTDYVSKFVLSKLSITLKIQGVITIDGSNPSKYSIIPISHSCSSIESDKVCQSVDFSGYITDEGRVIPCAAMAGSRNEDRFLSIADYGIEAFNGEEFNNFRTLSFNEILSENEECKTCPHLTSCKMGCRGASETETGDYYGTDDILCEFFKGDWEKKLKDAVHSKPNLYGFDTIAWEITGKCNLNCLHCFNAKDNAPLNHEFTLEEGKKLIKEAAIADIKDFIITGGEPLLHPNFFDFAEDIVNSGMRLREINTNGFYINEEVLERIGKLNKNVIFKISFDGFGHHDWMRNHKGAEEFTLRAIRLCIEKGFRVKVQTQMHRKNIDVLNETMERLDEMGVEETRFIRTTEAPRWRENAGDACLTIEEYYDKILDMVSLYKKKPRKMVVNFWQTVRLFPKERAYTIRPAERHESLCIDSYPICRLNRHRIGIGANGNLYPCLQLSGGYDKFGDVTGNVKKDSLIDLLAEGPYIDDVTFSLGQFKKINKECANCEFFVNCFGGCRAIGYALTDNKYGTDYAKCIFFKKGYLEKYRELLADWQNKNPTKYAP